MTCGCSFMNYAAWSNKQATGSLQEKAIIFPQPCKFPINRIIIGVNWDDTQLIAIVCFLVLMWPWSFYLLQHTHRVGIWLQSVPPGSPAGDSGLSQRAVTGQQEHLRGGVGSEGQPRVGNSGALWVGVCVCGITVSWRSSQGQSSQPLCETEFSPNILYVGVCVWGRDNTQVCLCVCICVWLTSDLLFLLWGSSSSLCWQSEDDGAFCTSTFTPPSAPEPRSVFACHHLNTFSFAATVQDRKTQSVQFKGGGESCSVIVMQFNDRVLLWWTQPEGPVLSLTFGRSSEQGL